MFHVTVFLDPGAFGGPGPGVDRTFRCDAFDWSPIEPEGPPVVPDHP